MNSLKAQRCSTMLEEYRRTKKVAVRNKLYGMCSDHLVKCLKTSSRKQYTETELLSMSWDAFMRCTERHVLGDDFADSLANAVRNTLNGDYAQRKKKNANEKNIGENEYPENDSMEAIVIRDALISLKDFRDVLPKNYRIVLDDCLASFGSDTRSHQSRISATTLPMHRYYESKKLMAYVVKHILGWKDNNEKSKKEV